MNHLIEVVKRVMLFSERTRLTGLTLWLSMMGVARAQTLVADNDTPPFSTLYKWKQIDFEFPSPRHRRHAMVTGYALPVFLGPATFNRKVAEFHFQTTLLQSY